MEANDTMVESKSNPLPEDFVVEVFSMLTYFIYNRVSVRILVIDIFLK